MRLRKAEKYEKEAVLRLYRSVIGRGGCTWSESYPGDAELDGDISAGTLYVYEDAGAIAGAVSVVPENELDKLPEWAVCDGNQREIARVAVAPAYQGRGLAAEMLSVLFELMKSQGVSAVHILAAKQNPAAIKTYVRLGFAMLEEHYMFGSDFISGELIL